MQVYGPFKCARGGPTFEQQSGHLIVGSADYPRFLKGETVVLLLYVAIDAGQLILAVDCKLIQQRDRRRTRQRTPFGDEDIQVVFAGLGINSPELATDELLRYAHSQEYINEVAATATMSPEAREAYITKFDCAVFNEFTNRAARLSVGALTNAVDSVMRGDVRNAICLTRPPGHHAMNAEACGFCVFNNVEIAAKFAIDRTEANRVLIVDWDVHHGQATQYAFYNDNKVLYFSIHRYDDGAFWPKLRESNYDFVGEGRGYGYNINIPLNGPGYTDNDYLTIFNCLLMPIAYEFDPDLILVSAGYDCALGCPLGCFSLTPSVFAHLTHRLMALADGKVVVTLEGGYNTESLADSVANTVATLLGDPLPSLEAVAPVKPGKKVMEPFTGVEEFGLTPEELAIATAKVVDLRQVHTPFSIDNSNSHQPECPARIRRAYELLEEYGLARRCKRTEARVATRDELLRVHDADYVDLIEQTSRLSQADLNEAGSVFDSIYFNKALHGVAVIRPPGHHAEKDSCAGFCFFNNVALAVRHAQEIHDRKRIAVVDWDVHHGNGIQHEFEEDPSVLYISMHRFDDGKFFPGSQDAAATAVGTGAGEGKTANLPWNSFTRLLKLDTSNFYGSILMLDSSFCWFFFQRPVRDGDYITAFLHFVLPLLYEFRPELTFIAAGFDAARGDHLGGFGVSPECFGHMTHLLTAIATLNPSTDGSGSHRGGLILALEGGYNLAVTSEALSHCVASLLGDTCLRLNSGIAPTERSCRAIRRTVEVHRKYWKSLFNYSPITCYCDADTLSRWQAAVTSSQTAGASTQPATEVSTVTFTADAGCLTSQAHADMRLTQSLSIENTSESTLTPTPSWTGGLELVSVGIPVVPETALASVLLPTDASTPPSSEPTQSMNVPESVHEGNETSHVLTTTATATSVSHASTVPRPPEPSASTSHVQRDDEVPSDTAPAAAAGSSMSVPQGSSLNEVVQFVNTSIDDVPAFFGLNSDDRLPERIFAVEPILWCAHLQSVTSASAWHPDINGTCTSCPNRGENWVCLTCYQVYCGRYASGHMLEHFSATRHPIVLSFADLSAWCYICNSYVHNEVLLEAKRAAHLAKFGERMPTYLPRTSTGLAYDKRMTLHRHEWFSGEQESPSRISGPFSRIQSSGLLSRCVRVPARHVSKTDLLRIHSEDYVELVKRSARFTKQQLYDLSGQFDATPLHPPPLPPPPPPPPAFLFKFTWTACSLAAGTVQHLASLVVSGQLSNGLALVRPPGHHAMRDEACGYCIFNNVAVAAASFLDSPPKSAKLSPATGPSSSAAFSRLVKSPLPPVAHASSNKGRSLKRILIVDWDVHQGQGTQYAFYRDKRVLFISIHRYENAKFWPNLREGDFDFIGEDEGRGYNINIPLNTVRVYSLLARSPIKCQAKFLVPFF
ncbi:unnamed protein product [Schistocephalus solidus]|uniref:UBP-type domain-containing protein n=1 Tax=Schistocephalus solidus TaxID=70667 RepID=A0A183SM61_SCHSO|nr:unnamed protein product [Schistocephalus solidus]